ncbi:uncharacterized protein LACBIDRAFT_308238 [Laccaria bicolor S238N-H82]|uniref:Predicted protein n=1 Tax=Laccaria bicolor (strain S238N-H82 / ATCC MYA-4686) TaxID=486041 RepID=B0DRW6_LACBS|nr:uncharacterized protein LACBIDRAFT_308238 [Laccaria bicolor S238N-H82]EDR02686.1 predicted protein [Laccaria bicolor S238N-H82]|eukprot:XP_001886730.1 predicted protein [Laccaria bicolor S238N-H82]
MPVKSGQDRFTLTGLVLCGLGPVWLRSFSSHKTGLPNTSEALGSCMWAQVATRPDIAFALSILSCFQTNPRPAH